MTPRCGAGAIWARSGHDRGSVGLHCEAKREEDVTHRFISAEESGEKSELI